MASVVFSQASRIYPGTTKPAVDKLDLTVNDGEFLVLVGNRLRKIYITSHVSWLRRNRYWINSHW